MADKNSTAGETTTSGPSSPLIPNLPNDVSLQCIARIPRPYHSSLSAVSKSWRSIIRSPEFFSTRSLLRSTQQSLYLSIRVNSSFDWYLLNQNHKACKNPNLSPIEPLPTGAAFAVLSTKLYIMGGSINKVPSNKVWIFDFRFNTWEIGPNMRVERHYAVAGAVNGKIYVIGGSFANNMVNIMNWSEVFDPVIGVWEAVSSPIEVVGRRMYSCHVLDGRIYAKADGGGAVYNAVTGEWATSMPKQLDLGWSECRRRPMIAVVDGVMYVRHDDLVNIMAYNVERDAWNVLKGVDKILLKLLHCAAMVSLNGNLCVVWERRSSKKGVGIKCAEIEVRKDDDGEGFTGSVLWSDVILSGPFDSHLVQCLSVDL